MSGVAALVERAARSRRAPLRRDAAHARSSAALPRRRADERDTGNGPPPTRHLHSRAPPHTARTHAWRFPPQRNAPLAVAPNVAAHGGPPPAETHSHNFAAPLVAQAPRAAARADRQTKAARHDALAIPVQIAAPGVGHSRSNDEVNDETQQ
ncbi:hypothetical protein [Burkholderia pseudomallei]|uniref:hypothetical protein n=1 Tax=Burkholderia pseudomallei TaxID=28450 RepID=UPI0003131A9C|nr:hypothetical protein [Burkholderia pseudomallei]